MNPELTRPIVVAHRLSKYHGPFVAVHEVSFTVPAGQVVALVGPNGAGKTTIMRMLTGYLAPSAGSATIGGFDVQKDRLTAAELIGYLPENGPLYPDMTPLEVLRFFGEARGLTPVQLRERIDVVSWQCGVRPILDKQIANLSKGLRQRVGMAQALLHDPAVLIMDEPTAGLDPLQIRHLRSQLQKLREHKTLLVSTHILSEVRAFADRVLVIGRGRLLFDGTPAQLGAADSLEERFCELTDSHTLEDPAGHQADSGDVSQVGDRL